jgi:ELWxxDGT repeat protein
MCSAIIAAALLLTPGSALANGTPRPAGPDEGEPLAGPRMVGTPAPDSASALSIGWMEFITVGDEAYFVTEGEQAGELWRTDGTTDGTLLVTDRFATKREDPISQMTPVGDELYFVAEDRKHGVELWRTDGTDAGTTLVVDLNPGEGRSYPSHIVPLDDFVLFWAKGAGGACGLWRTDGTPAGTALVRGARDFGALPADRTYCPKPQVSLRLGADLILVFGGDRHKVWRSDGTEEGTTLVYAFPRRSRSAWVVTDAGVAFFAADDGTHGRELWRTDGTVEGTRMVADVAPGKRAADPEPVAAVDGTVYFLANFAGGGQALWRTDGTADGTSKVRRIRQSWQYDIATGDSLLYFWDDDGRHGSELWRTDGTRRGTFMLRDIAKGRRSAGPMGYSDTATVGDLAFFAADDGKRGLELWSTDGTRAGTRLVADTGPGKGGTGPSWITRLGDIVLFSADDRTHGRELWRSDGTTKGTHLVRDIGARPAEVTVFGATAVGEDLVYLGGRGARGAPLTWVDGPTGQERRLASINRGEISQELATLGDGVVFAGASGRHGAEPWVSAGTRSGTRMLRDVGRGRTPNLCATRAGCGTRPADSSPETFVTIGQVTYFTAGDKNHGRELWRTDGTRAGTRLVKDIGPGRKSGIQGKALARAGDLLYFAADDGRHGSGLWRSDGTSAGTRLVKDLGPGWSVAWWDCPVPSTAGDLVYFTAETKRAGLELWVTDGTASGTRLVKDIRRGPKASKPEDLTAVGDLLYFTATDGKHGRELWRTDGTAEGTTLVADLTTGKGGSLLGELAALGDELVFAVWDGSGERVIPGILYRTDSTDAGTQPLGPVGGGGGLRRHWSEFPATVRVDDRLVLVADDGISGLELWSTDGTAAGTELVYDLQPGPKGSAPEWLVAADGYLYFTADDGEHGRQLWQLPVHDT